MASDSARKSSKYEKIEPVIVGGMVLDVHAIPSRPSDSGTTVPGKVHHLQGGVARNVAECMSKLGIKPFMISALGLDLGGSLLLEGWKSAGLSMQGIRRGRDISTPVVCNVFDINGEVAVGVASVDSVEKFLTSEWIQQFEHNICSAPILMVDANLSMAALETSCKLAAEFNVPVWFEPVSVTKSQRIASIAQYATVASPNEDELIAMANALSRQDIFSTIRTRERNISVQNLFGYLKPAIWVLLEKGISIVIVTLGSQGALLCSKGNPKTALRINRKYPYGGKLCSHIESLCPSDRYSKHPSLTGSSRLFAMHFPSLDAKVARLTGAGDCLVGGTMASLSDGLDLMQSLAVGIASAKAAVESHENVPPAFCLAALADDAKAVYDGAKFLSHQSML